jgi:hypothetical protein
MTIEELLAREGIRKTIARYTEAGDGGRYEDLIPCYAEDGTFEIATGRWTGRAVIGQALRTMRKARDEGAPLLQRHHLGTCFIELLGPQDARAITYFTVVSQTGLDHAGRYLDRLTLRDGTWQFAHRNVVVEWRSPDSGFMRGANNVPKGMA